MYITLCMKGTKIVIHSHNSLPDCSLGENNGLFSEESNETQEVSMHTALCVLGVHTTKLFYLMNTII